MKVFILGNSPQERGEQLEELTKTILKSRGYSDLTLRTVSAGGHEIDVCGERVFPGFSKKQKIKMISECKAHAAPTSMTDWLKFLGKVYVEEASTNNTITGCFISLSGVNGNVTGCYDSLLSQGKNNIELVSGEELAKTIYQAYKSKSVEHIINIVSNKTDMAIIGASICYYDNFIYWLVNLQEDTFVLADISGVEVENVKVLELVRNNNEISGKLVSLNEESKLKEHNLFVEKTILTLLLVKKSLEVEQLQKEAEDFLSSKNRQLAPSECSVAVKKLQEQGLVRVTKKQISLNLKTYSCKVEVYRKLLSGFVLIDTIVAARYRYFVDDGFIAYCLSTYQCGLELNSQQLDTVLKAIQVSPSALMLVITEIQMITQHRKNQPFADKAMDEHDREYLERLVMEKLAQDFSQQSLKEYFHNTLGIVELEMIAKIKVKSMKKVEFESNYKKREALGELTEELGGGVIRIVALNNSPEPWERA